ncbi:MAG: ArnT family glycosyltransferase [Saprospiraceae bacterium]
MTVISPDPCGTGVTSSIVTKEPPRFLMFLVVWFVLNVLQAAFTYLDPDEAYYWMYSKVLDWGYFDHPLAIPLLIKMGYGLITNELGVRLFVILAQLASFYGIWVLVGKPQEKSQVLTLIALIVAMPMLHVYGFVATPDAPLLLFTVWFLVLYNRFIKNDNWLNTLLLGASMAALLYSKYHGVLLILFILFSNLKLLFNPKFYIASVFGALLFFPHLYWQYTHDFPSFRYHLVGRDDPYELKHTVNYIINQLVIFNPLLFPFILYALFRQVNKNALFRAFGFIIFGFWVFFLYTTSKGHVEPQWTVILTIPFIIITWHYAIIYANFSKWIRRFAIITAGLLLIMRIGLLEWNVYDIKTNFHRVAWISELQRISGGLPIVFENSYRDPSMYTFYTGNQAYTFTDINYRRSQFDLWDWEKNLHNQKVIIAGQEKWACTNCETLKLSRKTLKVKVVDSLQIAQKVYFDYQIADHLQAGQQVEVPLTIHNPYQHSIHFGGKKMSLQPVAIFYASNEEKAKGVINLIINDLQVLPAQSNLNTTARFTVPEHLQGKFVFALGIRTGDLPAAFNSALKTVELDSPASESFTKD